MYRCRCFSRRLLFVCVFFLILPFSTRAAMQDSAHELTGHSAQSGSLPGDPLTEAGLYTLLGSEKVGDAHPLSLGETCCILCSYLEENKLVLPRQISAYPENSDSLGTNRTELLRCYQGGILGENFDARRADETVSTARGCLLVSRFLNAIREPDYAQPVSSLAEDSAQSVESLQKTLMMGHSIAHGLFLSVASPMDYAVKDGVSTYDYLETSVRLSDYEWDRALVALQREQYAKIYVLLGTNDTAWGMAGLENYETQLSHILELVQYFQPEAKLCLISISPIGFNSYVEAPFGQDTIRAYNQVQKTLSRRFGIDYLDIFSFLANEEGYNRPDITREDGLHYTQEGYEQLLRYIYTHPLR